MFLRFRRVDLRMDLVFVKFVRKSWLVCYHYDNVFLLILPRAGFGSLRIHRFAYLNRNISVIGILV